MFSEGKWFNPGGAAFDTELIGNSIWLDGSADFLSAELGAKTRTKAVIGTWIQKTGFTTSDATIFSKKGSSQFALSMMDQSSKKGKISIFDYDGSGFQYVAESTTKLLRDIGWYHIMISIDTTADAGSRLKYYINGIDQTSTLTVATDYTLNDNPSITGGSGEPTHWGVGYGGTSQFNPCYLAQSFMLDDDSIQNSDVAVSDILESFSYGDSGSQFGPKADADIAALATSAGGDSHCLTFGSPFGGVKIDDSGSTKSGNMTGNGGLAAIFDGDTTKNNSEVGSGVNTSSNDSFVVVDHGSAKTVTKFVAYASSDAQGFDGDTGSSILTFTLAGSTDNFSSSNVTLFSDTVSDPQGGGIHTIPGASSSSGITAGAYRYHKMTLQTNTTNSGQQFGQLAQLEYYEGNGLGTDSSDNGNHFVETSMSAANQSTNTPSIVFSTYNILDANAAYSSVNDGANTFVVTNVAGAGMRSTIPMTSGKWYWEQRNAYNEAGPAVSAGQGFVNLATNSIIGEGSGSHSCYLRHDGTVRINASTGSSIGVTNGATAVMGVAFDADSGKVWFRDSSGFGSSGDPAAGSNEHATLATTSAPFFIASYVGGAISEPFLNAGGNPTFNGNETAGGNADANGHGNFKLGAVPSGFLSLCSANLTAPDAQGIDHFAVTLAQEGSLFSGMGTAESAYSATLRIYKSRASASASETWGYSFSHDSSNEYTLGTANSALTYGSIRSLSGTDNWVGYSLNISSSAGTAAGSQAHSNGSDTTVTHSLGSSRYIVLLFNRSGGDIFYYHPDLASGNLLKLNNSVLPFSSTVITDITTNSFDIGSAAASATYDYLVLAETPGVTDVFSYIGNGNANGPYLSFNAMPEFMTFKLTTTHATEHIVLDQTRSPINDADIPYIMTNQLAAEADNTTFLTDFLSGAAKIRNSSTDGNFSGGTFVGWSFGKIAGGGTLPPIYGR